MSRDSEDRRAEIHYVKGYPSFAGFINSDCDKSTAIYRRFGRLSARNLLHLQSELVELEARQDALDIEYLRGTLEDKKSARDWQTLKKKGSRAWKYWRQGSSGTSRRNPEENQRIPYDSLLMKPDRPPDSPQVN